MIASIAAALPSQSVIAPALATLLSLFLLLRGILLLSRKPTPARIGSIAPGQAEIHGAAIGPYAIKAPISGKDCYLYRATVWQQSKTGTWEKLVDETLHIPFFVADSTGRMLIEPMGAELDVPVILREEYSGSAFSSSDAIPQGLSDFLARHRAVPTSRILAEEFCIEPDTQLFVAGAVMENPGVEVRPLVPNNASGRASSSVQRDEPSVETPEVVRLSDTSTPLPSAAPTQQSRIAAALIKAGIKNPSAWDAAGIPYPGPAAATAVLEQVKDSSAQCFTPETASSSGFTLKPRLVLMKGGADEPFVISSRGTQRSSPLSAWKAFMAISVGAALTIVSLWFLLSQIHGL